MKKKLLAGLICLILLVFTAAPAAAAGNGWAQEALQSLQSSGVIKTDADGSLRENEYATRAELCAMLVRLFNLRQTADLSKYKDVQPDKWYYAALQKAKAAGIIHGGGNEMQPNAALTRQEAFTMLGRAFRVQDGEISDLAAFADSGEIAPWAAPTMGGMVRNGIIKGSGGFLRPRQKLTRAELAQVIYRLCQSCENRQGMYEDPRMPELVLTLTMPDCSADDPTVTARLTVSGLPEGERLKGTLCWSVDGAAWKTVYGCEMENGTELTLDVSYVFAKDMAESSVIRAEFLCGTQSVRQETEIALINHADAYYERLASAKKPYRIDVLRDQNVVIVYGLDAAGKYTVVQNAFLCSTGKATPTGTFRLNEKSRWRTLFGSASSGWNYVYGQYAARIKGNILFHSVPYFSPRQDDLEYLEYNKLGTAASMGCIRLTTAAEKWLYDNCPAETEVHIFDKGICPVTRPAAPVIDLNSKYRGWDPTDPDHP